MSPFVTQPLHHQPLHEMNPQGRFSDRVHDYARYRPSYPGAAIDFILEGLQPLSNLRVADIGAGTGIASRLLANRGLQVIAVEPNASMRQAATSHGRVEFYSGEAEHTGLATASVDLVTCFQSFHWFDPEPTLTEFRQLLKPGGRLALVWNNRDQTDEFTHQYTQLIRAASNQLADLRLGAENALLTNSYFQLVHRALFSYRQALDQPGLIGRAMSTSYLPKTGMAHQQLIDQLKTLYTQYQDVKGLVYLTYQTRVYRAAPPIGLNCTNAMTALI